ncbi:MAG: CHASE2 domain-containing protein [Calditrichaeota bacterium]|nr:CHASE2 domain-containing protein [Calditrichota bacterium]RQV98438.1 MAG: CHASE2 domain-containing protein [Calditrichota bacterium]
MTHPWRKKLLTGILVGLFTGLFVWLLTQYFFAQFFFRLESQTYDWRLRRAVEPPPNPIEEIVIIDVDERSIQKLGSYYTWPRDYWIRLIRYLDEAEVSLIGLDFIFDPNPRHPEEDREFQQAMEETGKVCNAFYFSTADMEHYRPAMVNEPPDLNYRKFTYQVPDEFLIRLMSQDRFEPTYPGFLNAGMTAGYVGMFPDPDGVLRRLPVLSRFNQHVYPAFSVEIAMRMKGIQSIEFDEKNLDIILLDSTGTESRVPVDSYGQMLIHYAGGFKSFRYLSFYDVLMGFMQKNYFRDKIVLVGTSLPGFYDLRTTPLQPAFPGVEVNANVIYQLLNGLYIYQMKNLSQFILILMFSLVAGIILIFPRPLGSILLTALILFLVLLAGIILLEQYSFWLPVFPLIFALIIVFIVTYIYRYLFEEKDKRQIRKVFSHYVSPAVVDVLLKNPEMVKLGGEKKFCTVLFSDIEGFTSMSEKMEPTKLVHLLNNYLTSMTNVVLENRGMLDKYEGDAIMAIFGAPVELPNSAELACLAALEMQKQLGILNEYWQKIDRPYIRVRIGINSGEMIVGNMGSENRFDYTVVGDSVNLASRLESANRIYRTNIMMGEATFDLVQEKFVTRPLDLLRVTGKKNPVRTYELIARREESIPESRKNLILDYKRGFKEYLLRNWQQGMIHFEKALTYDPDDGPSRVYLDRCREFSKQPPPPDWDGVCEMKSK